MLSGSGSISCVQAFSRSRLLGVPSKAEGTKPSLPAEL